MYMRINVPEIGASESEIGNEREEERFQRPQRSTYSTASRTLEDPLFSPKTTSLRSHYNWGIVNLCASSSTSTRTAEEEERAIRLWKRASALGGGTVAIVPPEPAFSLAFFSRKWEVTIEKFFFFPLFFKREGKCKCNFIFPFLFYFNLIWRLQMLKLFFYFFGKKIL